jgi:probable F420-dependent oxidoreductase
MAQPHSDAEKSLKIGLILVPFEDLQGSGVPHWSEMQAFATTAEAAGFDSLWVPDHLLFRSPDTPTAGAWEAWSLLSALAAVTSRIQLGTFVLSVPFRNPALLAKMADTVEEISNGRLILGLGAGWNQPEFDAFGFPFDHRASRFEEGVQIIHALLRDGLVDFEGTFSEARDCELRPRGPRPQGPPIMIGTTGSRMMELAARYADLWNVWLEEIGNSVDNLLPLLAAVDEACVAVGRDPATLERTAAVLVEVAPHPPSLIEGSPLRGTPEQLAEGLLAYVRAGITHVQVFLEPHTVEGIDAFAPVLALLKRSAD